VKKRAKGLSEHRFRDNPTERDFAGHWRAWNEEGRRTLAYLLDPEHGGRGTPCDPANRDAVVAATVIQWLGSPVGQNFLEEVGFVRKGSGR
jgi:hypothetical protein